MINIRDRIARSRPRERLRLEFRRARGPLAVYLAGLAVAAVSAGIILGNINVSLPWDDRRVVGVAVDNAKGIVPGKQEVRWAGVVVGMMTDVDLVDGQPVVTIDYDGEYGPLYRDARLRLRPQTALNDMFMDVESPGHRSAGELSDDDVLASERTRVPVDIADVLNVFSDDMRARMKQAIDELGRGLPDNGRQLRLAFGELAPFLRSAQRLTREFAQRRGMTRRLVHNFRLMVEELGRRDRTLTRLVASGDATFGELRARRDELARFVEALPPTLTRMRASFGELQATLDELDPALEELRPAAAAMPAGLAALRRFSADATPALRALRAPVASLAGLTEELRPTSRSLALAFERLVPHAPHYDRITAKALPCLLVIDKFFQWTPSVAKFSDANGVWPRGNTTSSSSTAAPFVKDIALKPGKGCTTGKAARP